MKVVPLFVSLILSAHFVHGVSVVEQTGQFTGFLPLDTGVADDFELSERSSIEGIGVWVVDIASDVQDGVIDGWSGLGWGIFENDRGRPGDIVTSGFSPNPSLSLTGTFENGGITYETFYVEAVIVGPVVLESGDFWLSIREGEWNTEDNANSSIGWLLSDGRGISGFVPIEADTLINPEFWDRVPEKATNFQLTGSIVPEVSNYALWFGFLAFVPVLLWRRVRP
ncbi:MAG: hypothetical protein AAGJ81_04215 [Verrucomicrobiota bacterium]